MAMSVDALHVRFKSTCSTTVLNITPRDVYNNVRSLIAVFAGDNFLGGDEKELKKLQLKVATLPPRRRTDRSYSV